LISSDLYERAQQAIIADCRPKATVVLNELLSGTNSPGLKQYTP
jgi:hypothetical protein